MRYDERKQEILKMCLEGKSHAEIGEHFHISRQRVQKIIKSIPELKSLPVRQRYVVDTPETS